MNSVPTQRSCEMLDVSSIVAVPCFEAGNAKYFSGYADLWDDGRTHLANQRSNLSMLGFPWIQDDQRVLHLSFVQDM